MKSRKTAALPGIVMAAVAIEDDCEFGREARKYLIRCGYLRKNEDGKYEACKS